MVRSVPLPLRPDIAVLSIGVEKYAIIRGVGGNGMSIMIDLPPAMAQEAQEYATVRGTTLERMLFDYLKRELDRIRVGRANRLSEFVGCIGNGRRTDEVVGELRGYDQW